MEQLTLKEAANSYYSENKHVYSPQTIAAFEAGAKWQKEQYKPIIELLKGIAEWAGNLPDNKLTTKTGANDAALRGGLITDMRSIAVEAIRKVEPDYVPFPGYTHSS